VPAMSVDPDTIVAIATPHGAGAVGVVRLSGNQVPQLLARHVRWRSGSPPAARMLARARFVDAAGGLVDEVLAVHFPAPRSYTGEDVAEIHAHGSRVILETIVTRLIEGGARLARPGEFTERAFLAGKIDLSQAEAVQALITARSRDGAALAQRLLGGELGRRIEVLQGALVRIEAEVEARIDFVEEELDLATNDLLRRQLAEVVAQVDGLLRGYTAARRLVAGVRVVLVGEVNVGKSSIFNCLLQEDRSIVTREAGTTRDYVEVEVEWRGTAVHLIDTAGLRTGRSAAECAGIDRSQREMERADLVLHVVDASQPAVRLPEDVDLPAVPTLVVWNKIDIGRPMPPPELGLRRVQPVCALSGVGIDRVREWVVSAGRDGASGDAEALLCLPRQRDAVYRARRALAAAQEGLGVDASPELIAVELREAQEALGEVVGSRRSDAVLEAIFSRFCVGK
jgi:tRNA modification GTPase